MAEVTISLDHPVTLPKLRVSSRARVLIPLAFILLLQTTVAMSLRNSAFQDEALYVYAGRQYFENMFRGGEPVIEPYALYFSGWPHLYPLIAGALDIVGGIEAARLFSLVCMLIVTACVFDITDRLFGLNSAILAAALYAVQGSVLFLSRLATYDALCLALAASATALALQSGKGRGIIFTVLVGFALFAAVASKYAGLMFVPTVLGVLAWNSWTTLGWKQAFIRVTLALAIIVACSAVVLLSDHEVLQGVQSTTTARQALLQTPRIDLATRSIAQAGLVTLVATVGLFLLPWKWRRSPLYLLFFATIFIAPAYHIYKMESFSLHKHIAYGLFFGAPLAGYALARFSFYRTRFRLGRRWLIGLAVCVLALGIGLEQARGFYREWANSDDLIQVMRTQVRSGSGRYLAEESEVMRYYLQDVVKSWQWNQLYWFYYTDRNGTGLQGVPAYKAAIDDAYFDLIILRYGPAVTTAQAIDGNLYGGKNYELLAKVPYFTMFGDGYYWVWRRAEKVEFMGRDQFATPN